MSDLQRFEYLKGRVDQLEQQLKLERSFYQEELNRISNLLSGNTKSVQTSIHNLRTTIGNNRKNSEFIFSSVWTTSD